MSELSIDGILCEIGLKIYHHELKLGRDFLKSGNIKKQDADSLKLLDVLWDSAWKNWWKGITK